MYKYYICGVYYTIYIFLYLPFQLTDNSISQKSVSINYQDIIRNTPSQEMLKYENWAHSKSCFQLRKAKRYAKYRSELSSSLSFDFFLSSSARFLERKYWSLRSFWKWVSFLFRNIILKGKKIVKMLWFDNFLTRVVLWRLKTLILVWS